MKLKITTVGNSAGIVLPKELLARLRLDKGDVLYATEIPGGIQLMPYDPNFETQMKIVEGVMKRRRTLLHKLAEN
jgi:putative addiction module antidote